MLNQQSPQAVTSCGQNRKWCAVPNSLAHCAGYFTISSLKIANSGLNVYLFPRPTGLLQQEPPLTLSCIKHLAFCKHIKALIFVRFLFPTAQTVFLLSGLYLSPWWTSRQPSKPSSHVPVAVNSSLRASVLLHPAAPADRPAISLPLRAEEPQKAVRRPVSPLARHGHGTRRGRHRGTSEGRNS